MVMTVGRAVALCALLGAGCATAHPNFEQTFRGGRPSRDQWMVLLTGRYGCDTALILASMPPRWNGVGLPPLRQEAGLRLQIGMTACDLASIAAPEVVDAWVDPEGIREEWKVRAPDGLTSIYLEGHDTNTLRVVAPLPALGRGRG